MTNIFISVIVPVYNTSNYLVRCLDSIKEQTYRNYEVIIINDGSTDNCQSIIEEYVNNNRQFRCFYKENGGLASARNLGIKKSRGEYIYFVDSDDYILNKSLEIMVNEIVKNEADMAICSFSHQPIVDHYSYYRQNINDRIILLLYSKRISIF